MSKRSVTIGSPKRECASCFTWHRAAVAIPMWQYLRALACAYIKLHHAEKPQNLRGQILPLRSEDFQDGGVLQERLHFIVVYGYKAGRATDCFFRWRTQRVQAPGAMGNVMSSFQSVGPLMGWASIHLQLSQRALGLHTGVRSGEVPHRSLVGLVISFVQALCGPPASTKKRSDHTGGSSSFKLCPKSRTASMDEEQFPDELEWRLCLG